MNQNGHDQPQQIGQFDMRDRYILFTSKVKHGHLLRYLLAAQARRRLLETYGLQRQVKSSALTGDPDQVFEIYYAGHHSDWLDPRPSDARDLSRMMSSDDAELYLEIQATIDAERIPALEVLDPNNSPTPHFRVLRQMRYMRAKHLQQEAAQELATKPYLLNDICVMKHKGNGLDNTRDLKSVLSDFNHYMFELIDSFAQSRFSLLVGAQFEDHPDWVLNTWQFENLEQHTELMLKLADNQLYSRLDEICHQEQHICRNVAHDQQHPFLML